MGNFHWHNPSSSMTTLGMTQCLKEMSTRNKYWEVKVASVEGWQLYHLHVPTILKSGSLNLMRSSWPVQGWIYLSTMSHVSAESTTLCTSIIFVIKTTFFLDVTSGRLVPNKCWCLFSKLCGVTLQNIMLFSPFLTRPLWHHMWKQGKFMVQFLDEVTETTHSSQQHSKQCEMWLCDVGGVAADIFNNFSVFTVRLKQSIPINTTYKKQVYT